MAYVDYNYYVETYGGTRITASEAAAAFQMASNAIDVLVYRRIDSDDMEGLTAFQKGIVQNVTCALADWQAENNDLLMSPYSSYSINGVNATWGKSAGVQLVNRVMIPNQLYSELIKTGLCYPGVR